VAHTGCMTGWMARKAAGDELEARVAGELAARGWAVSCWGQGALAAAVAASLRRTDSALRWAPDLLAAVGDLVVMIDCKASMTSRGTGRHAVERAAVRAHLQFAAIFDLPFYYVFDNLGVLTPMDVRAAGQAGPHSRVGSGAPYYLVSTAGDRDFSDVFGPGPCKARGAA
jgi:Holliday junction resolvase